MTSRISFFKLLKEDFKRRSWLVALIWLACFILQPVSLLVRVDGWLNAVKNGYTEMTYAIEGYRDFVGVGNDMLCILVLVVAAVAGISGYSHLHSRVKMDFYHSLPIPRKKFFFVQYVSGILMFFVPYAVCTLLCVLVGATNGLLTKAVAVCAVKMILFRMLEFLSVYGTAILGTILTGKLLTAILGTAVLAGYLPVVIIVMQGMQRMFFDTFMQAGRVGTHYMLLSSALSGMYAENMMRVDSQAGKWGVIGAGALIFWIVVMTGCSVWLYSIRRTEAAEHSMAFPKTEGAIKVLLVIPLSLAAGLYIQNMLYGTGRKWFFVAVLCAVVVLSAVIEFIYHLNMREIFRHKLQILLAGAVAVAVSLFFAYDIAGYDTYLPAKEDIAKMALYDDAVNGTFYYLDTKDNCYTSYSAEAALDATLVKNFDPIYELAKKGARGEEPGEEEENREICIEYRLKSGRREIRQYRVRTEEVEAVFEKLFGDPEFIEKIYPVFWKDMDEAVSEGMYVEGAFGSETLEISKEKRQELLELYIEELRTITYDDIKNHTISTLSLTTMVREEYGMYGAATTSYTESGYPICEKFTKTIAFLEEEAGIDVKQEITAADVSNIQITDYRGDGEGLLTTVTDPEQIQEILDCANYSAIYGIEDEEEQVDIFVMLNNGNSANGKFYFEKGNMPDFLNREE